MIDPDGIQIQEHNLSNKFELNNVPEFKMEIYCLEDDKEYERFIKDCESQVRRSFEYREFIKYLRDNMNMNQCAFLKDVSNAETFDIKIELHHYPFSLRDIVEIVLRKRQYYQETISIQMVAKEVMELHYKLMIGLISLSETVHELAHNSRLFIPSDKVIGRYNLFVQYYKPFCTPEQLEVLDRIEKYSQEQQSNILNTNIIEQNRISYEIKDSNYMLPDTQVLNTAMIEQMKIIKDNNYILPNINDKPMLEDKKIKQLVKFDLSLIKEGKYSWEE